MNALGKYLVDVLLSDGHLAFDGGNPSGYTQLDTRESRRMSDRARNLQTTSV